jgi:hypothetical protein
LRWFRRSPIEARLDLKGRVGVSVVIIVLIVGRIGMPADSVQVSVPFMPRWAVVV